MILACDIMMLVICTVVSVASYRHLFNKQINTIVDLLILVIYLFMCVPVICDHIIGLPEYNTAYWYKVFLPGMQDEWVCVVYDFYVSLVMCVLYFYSASKAKESKESIAIIDVSSIKGLLVLGVVAPVVFIVASNTASKYLVYADSGARGLDSRYVFAVNSLLLLSLYSFCLLFFSKKIRGIGQAILLVLYTFAISWINGKRFIVALALIMYLFMFLITEDSSKARRKVLFALPIMLGILLVFAGMYMKVIKPLTNTIDYGVYEMLRVDFGRDDVTKYVLYQTQVEGNEIIDYPGQSILAYLLFFVPRAVWPNKPFQHFQYLTSSILGVPISIIPAGTTPSGFEMFIANFGLLGIPLFSVTLLLMIRFFDKGAIIPSFGLLGLVLCTALLTQSIDVYAVYVALAALGFVLHLRGYSSASHSRRLGKGNTI